MTNYSEKEPAVQRFTYDGTVTKFYFQFPFSGDEDLVVFYGEEEKSLNIDYTSTPVLENGIATNQGYIDLVTFPESGAEIVIIRRTVLDRETDFASGSRFTADLVDSEFDQVLRQISDSRLTGTFINAPAYLAGIFDCNIKNFEANKVLSITEDGLGIETVGVEDIGGIPELTQEIQRYVDLTEENAALTNADVEATQENVVLSEGVLEDCVDVLSATDEVLILTNADVETTNDNVAKTNSDVVATQNIIDSITLPTLTSDDAYKVLSVNSSVDGYTLKGKIAHNLIKESQCVVPNVNNLLPAFGATRTYSDNSYLSECWKYYRGDSEDIRVNVDSLGNLVFLDHLDGGLLTVDVEIPPAFSSEGLFARAVYIDEFGGFKDVPCSIRYDLQQLQIPFSTLPTGRVFAVSVSQEVGDIEILAERTIIDNVLGRVGEGFEILEYGAYGNNSSGTIPQGYSWSDFSRVEIYSTSSIESVKVGSVTTITKEHLAANSSSWLAFANLSEGAFVRIGASSSTGWSIGGGQSNDGGNVSGIKGWF